MWSVAVSTGSDEERAEAAWEASGIPARCREWRLGTSPLGLGRLAELVKRLTLEAGSAAGLWEQSWCLWGESGVGKTGLAVGYAYQWVDPRFGDPGRVVFWSVPDLLGEVRASYGKGGKQARHESESAILGSCRAADLLVLDDIGREHVSARGWAEDRLFQVIGYRHAEMLPTMFTTNLAPPELAGRIGDAIVWRMVEMCGGGENVVHVKGRNLRDRKG